MAFRRSEVETSAKESDSVPIPVKIIIAGGFDRGTAERWLEEGRADLIAFGRKFIANPDLPERFRQGAPLNPEDPTTFYGGGAKGYTDYPSLAQDRGEQPKPCVDARWR